MNDRSQAISIAKQTKEAWLKDQTPEGQEIIEILDNNLQDWEPNENDLEVNDM